jgi:hypothetical protein
MNVNKMEITQEYLLEEYVKKRRNPQDLIKELNCEYKEFENQRIKLGIKRDRAANIIGQTFGSWTVLQKLPPKKEWGSSVWLCECICGTIKPQTKSGLKKTAQCKRCANIQLKSKDIVTGSYWHALIKSAKKRKKEINISRQYAEQIFISQNGRCAITNLPINFPETTREKDRNSGNASLDRINSEIGYVEGNIQWVHKVINKMKQNLPQEEFIKFCKLITKHQEEKHGKETL